MEYFADITTINQLSSSAALLLSYAGNTEHVTFLLAGAINAAKISVITITGEACFANNMANRHGGENPIEI